MSPLEDALAEFKQQAVQEAVGRRLRIKALKKAVRTAKKKSARREAKRMLSAERAKAERIKTWAIDSSEFDSDGKYQWKRVHLRAEDGSLKFWPGEEYIGSRPKPRRLKNGDRSPEDQIWNPVTNMNGSCPKDTLKRRAIVRALTQITGPRIHKTEPPADPEGKKAVDSSFKFTLFDPVNGVIKCPTRKAAFKKARPYSRITNTVTGERWVVEPNSEGKKKLKDNTNGEYDARTKPSWRK